MPAQATALERAEARIANIRWQIAKLQIDEDNYKKMIQVIQDRIALLQLELDKYTFGRKGG